MNKSIGLILIAIGLFTFICTFLKPDFYWESRKANSMRRIIGDLGASILYYLIGTGVTIIGALILTGLVQ